MVLPFKQVSVDHAYKEGEEDRSLAYFWVAQLYKLILLKNKIQALRLTSLLKVHKVAK
ncbi:hypothetical protein QM950_05730 [Streptococcus vestibularis]